MATLDLMEMMNAAINGESSRFVLKGRSNEVEFDVLYDGTTIAKIVNKFGDGTKVPVSPAIFGWDNVAEMQQALKSANLVPGTRFTKEKWESMAV